MAHVIIIAFILVLGAGIVGITYLFSVSRPNGEFTIYRRHLFLLNLFILVNLAERYFKSYLFSCPGGFDLPRLIEVIVKEMSIFCIIGLAYLLIRTISGLQSRSLSGFVVGFYVTVCMVCLAGFGASSAIYFIQNDHRWLHLLYKLSNGVVIFTTTAILLHALSRNRVLEDERRKHLLEGMIGFYVVGFFLVFVALLFGYPTDLYISTVVAFLINIFPLIRIRRWLCTYEPGVIPFRLEQNVLDRIVRRYAISEREKSILVRMVEGRSNHEIKDELFISIHTVKNHIHNLYRKLGINNRSQLLHLFMKGSID